ncbi:hypothetical protein BU25DRAFT_209873 [Macroventuria anomochaeta]|uniref:Uncharacterized protein n=1 Tax=Macroventuria anomochaeta TaxID=301207 RepID=A0ACB6RNI8_9PLEO|nr:uncharacterized protein BU25DRAFT_209873 [Macroventuria anomochaeta]KAF2622507.1 hypothetical protein BU25DRAFT_209873 [Macroventuria anomochaeta]
MSHIDALMPHVNRLFARGGGFHPPSEVLLSWPKPNYINPEDRGWSSSIVLLVFLGITFLVYIARMWARLGLGKNAGLDDVLMSVAMIPLFGLTISAVLAIRIYGFQWHVWDQTKETLVTARQITMSIEINYMICTTLIKISILCFYRRITASLTITFVYWVWGSIAFCVIYGVTFIFLIALTCTPAHGFFHIFDIAWRFQNELTCRDEGAVIVAVAAISTVQDFIIALLPVFLIWKLQIPRTQKLALCGIFGLGLVTCVCGILRTYYATYVYYYTYDITWYAYYGWIWTALEADLAVICASAPALKIFFRCYFSLTISRSDYAKSGSGSRKTSAPLSSTAKSRGKGSTFSASRITAGGTYDDEVPMNSIKVSQGLDVHIDERDDVSQKSFASTGNLTALPMPQESGWQGPSQWIQGCRTVCAALRPSSRGSSQTRSFERDVEIGAAR